jgi:hypothetical protein
VVLGEELVVNGSFDTDSDWSKTNAVIADGKATVTVVGGVFSRIFQPLTYTSGREYRITALVQGLSGSNGKQIRFMDNGGNSGGLTTTNGTVTLDETLQSIEISWVANSNSDGIFIERNTSIGDYTFTIDNVSIKEKIDADFTFTRNSSATRVNELGYIEDVQIIGGELVSNGDFEQIGSELVTNGSFSTDSDWTKGTGWSIANGKASCDGTGGSILRQFGAAPLNTRLRVTFEVRDYVSGNLQVKFAPIAYGVSITENGIYTIVTNGDNSLNGDVQFLSNSFIGSIDNVSVKEVGQDWTFGNGWSMGDGKAVFSDTANGDIRTQFIFTAGNKYRINLSVSDLTSGTAFFALGDGASNNLVTYNNYANGDYTFDVTAVNGAELRIYATTTSSSSFSIDNVSVKEVTDDTNLPRINYEGFTYAESLGNNLLSDPVNLVTDFLTNSGGVIVDSNTFTTSGGSLDGIRKTFLTTGKRYKLVIQGSTTSSGFTIGNLSVSGNEYGSGFGTHYFTAANTGLWIRQNTAGTTDITSFKVQEVIGNLPVPYSGKGHLLLEPQRTNLFTYSEDIDEWSTNNTGITLEENAVTSPEGVANATKIKEDGTNASHVTRQLFGPVLSSGTDYAFSFFAKKAERSIVGLSNTIGASNNKICFFDLDNGKILTNTFNSASIEDFGNGWYRCIATDTADANDDYDTRIYTATADNQFSHQGVSGSGLYIFGLQLEAGTYPTSYIPTLNGTTVTRLGETCNNATQSFPSEGVLYAEIAALFDDNTNRIIALSDGTSSNRIILLYDSVDNNLRCQGRTGGVSIFDMSFVVTSFLDFNKLAIRYKDNNFSFWVNGVQVGTDTSGTVPTGLDEINFDRGDGSGSSAFYGKTKMVATFSYLSNDEMECLTGQGYGTFEALAAAYSYTIK